MPGIESMKFTLLKMDGTMNNRFAFVLFGLLRVILRPRRAKKILGNFFLDVKYAGTYLGIPLSNGNNREGYTNTTSSEYDVLNNLFSKLSISSSDIIVDVGCGSGRVLGWLAMKYPQNKVMGIEIDPKVAKDTTNRMKKYSKVEIIIGNVLDKDTLKEGTIFYLFHPFHEQPMRQFIAILKDLNLGGCFKDQRPLIVYHNCYCLHVFEEDPMWKIQWCGDVGGLPTAMVSL